jgi:hypothetical protein
MTFPFRDIFIHRAGPMLSVGSYGVAKPRGREASDR